jgi:hypothetical protein
LICLSTHSTDSFHSTLVKGTIQNSIFSPDNLVDYGNALTSPRDSADSGFNSVLKEIVSENQLPFDGAFHLNVLMTDLASLPLLLHLGLDALNHPSSKITMDQKSLLAATFLSSLDSFSIPSSSPQSASSVIYLSRHHLQKLYGLLQIFGQENIPSSESLSTSLNTIATSCLPFLDFADESVIKMAWNALAIIMKIEFDVIFNLMDRLYPKIPSSSLEFMKTLLETNFKLRSGVDFIKSWTNLLNESLEGNVLMHPELLSSYVS